MANRDLSVNIRINAEDNTRPGIASTRAGIDSIDQQLSRLRTTVGAFLAINVGSIISSQIGEIIKTADAYKTLEARLKIVSDNTAEYTKAQSELFNIAQRTRGDLESTYTLYGRLETAIKQLGGTQGQALKTTETVSQAIALSGGNAETAKAGVEQFNQSLASGTLRGQEFNSVMLNTPALAQAIADGMGVTTGKLRTMAEAGQLTADKLVNALGVSADAVNEKFGKLPLTVGGAMTNLSSAFTVFIGQTDKSANASATLADGISTLAKNLDNVADIGLMAAEIYGAKLALGLSKSAQSFVESAQAAYTRAAADRVAQAAALELLRTETQVAAIRVTTSRQLVEEARLQLVLANTDRERALAQTQITRSMAAYHAANTTAINRNADLAAALNTTTAAASRTGQAFNLLNKAMMGGIFIQVGLLLADLMAKFEQGRVVLSYFGETAQIVGSGIIGMFNGISLPERWAEVKKIHADFSALRAKYTDETIALDAATIASKETQTKALEASTLKQQQSYASIQAAAKSLTASIDAESKQQTALIEQSLTDRLAAIDATDISETQKDTLRTTAKLQSYQAAAVLQQQASTEKLALIDREYAAELAAAANNAQRLNEVETSKRQAKLSVYTGLADYYQGEVARLSQVYATEIQQAAQARQQLEDLNISHEQALFNIQLMGMDERHKLDAQETKFNDDMAVIKKEQMKGQAADQELINAKMADAKTLNQAITAAAGTSSDAIREAKDRENKLYDAQRTVLDQNAKAHEDNASRTQTALQGVEEKLLHVQGVANQISAELNKGFELKIGLDEASLTAAQSTIANLTKTETKTIVIQTVSGGGSAPAGEGGQTGGLAYAIGGYAPRFGKLGGYGGGDKIKALLEAGEFIVRKEAVQKLGVPFMEAVNNSSGLINTSGQMTFGGVIKRAFGGGVGYDMATEIQKKKDERDKASINELLNNTYLYSLNSLFMPTKSTFERNARTRLQGLGQLDLLDKVLDIAYTNWDYQSTSTGISGIDNQRLKNNQTLSDKAGVLREHLFDTGAQTAAKVPPIKLPTFTRYESPSATSPGTAASSQLLSSKTVNINFAAPGGAQPVTGQFNETDIDKLLKTLKDSGLRSTGGHF